MRVAGARRLRRARLARARTASPGTTTKTRRSRPSTRSCTATSTQFLRLAPAYGGSLIERAPFALCRACGAAASSPSTAWSRCPACSPPRCSASGSSRACAPSGVRAARARARARPCCVANPITLRALELGHPEELLGACLCVAAVLLRRRRAARALGRRSRSGSAIANKEWALLAAGPVLLALPAAGGCRALRDRDRRRRAPCSRRCCSSARAAFIARHTRQRHAAIGSIFQPWQVWWFLGHHGAVVHGAVRRAKPGYRIAPGLDGRDQPPADPRRRRRV